MNVPLSVAELGVLVNLIPADAQPALHSKITRAWCAATLVESGVSEDDPRVLLMRAETAGITNEMVLAANAVAGSAAIAIADADASDDTNIKLPAWDTGEVPITPPFGWRIEDGKVVADRNEHLVMKYVLLGRKNDYTYQQVADDLNGRRLRNRKGKRWTSSSASRIHKVSCGLDANLDWVNRWA